MSRPGRAGCWHPRPGLTRAVSAAESDCGRSRRLGPLQGPRYSRQRSLGPDKDVSQGKGRDIGRPGSENRCAVGFQRRSKRSRFITLTHAFAKSSMNVC